MISILGSRVGIEVDSNNIRVTEVLKKYNKIKLNKFISVDIPEGNIKDGLITDLSKTANLIKKLLQSESIKQKRIAISIGSHHIFTKKVQMKGMSETELSQIFLYEAAHHFPFDLKDITVDYHIIEKRRSFLKVLFTAIRNDIIENRMELLRRANLTPYLIEPCALSIINLYNHTKNGKRKDVIVNIGDQRTTIIKPSTTDPYISNISYGSIHLSAKDRDEKRFYFSKWYRELSQKLLYINDNYISSNPERILVCGEITSHVFDTLKLKANDVRFFDPFKNIVNSDKWVKYAHIIPVSLGLTLRKAGDK